MTPSDEVRKLLDERGIKHTIDYMIDDSNDYEITEWQGQYNLWWQFLYDPYEEAPYGELRLLDTGGSTHLTPDQAIAATLGRSCESCPEVDNPDSYIVHLHRALEVADSVAGTCQNIAELNREGVAGYFFVCSECGLAVHASFDICETNYPYCKPDGSTDLRTFNSNGYYEFERCPRCGRKVTE